MKIFLHNRKDVKVLQNGLPLKVQYKSGQEYVEPTIGDDGAFEISFVKRSEFSGAFWFLKAVAFWIIGIMGFFTPKYAKCSHALDCKLSGVDNGEALNVSFIHPNPRYGAVTGVKVRENGVSLDGENYVPDNKAYKRRKAYKLISGILRLGVIAFVVYVIIKAIIG